MKNIRTFHFYAGVFFAPLLIYFALSGMWQVFHLHHHPRGQEPTAMQETLDHLSAPHTDGTFPGLDPKDKASVPFRVFSDIMALGFIMTALLGIQMAWQFKPRRKKVLACIIIGALLPLLLLFVHA